MLIATACLVVGSRFVNWDAAALLFDRQALIEFFSMAKENPVRSVSVFVLAHVVANAVGVPGTVLVIVGGAVYGLWWGMVWSVIGATLGAIAAFWLARYLLHDWFQKRFAHRPMFQRMNKTLCKNGLSCVLLVRFSPVSPFNVVNFAFGLTPVHVRFYALGTLIGIIPGTLVYTWLGVSGAEALSGGSLIPLFCCLAMLMLLSAVPFWLQRRSAP
ncbi:MAG: TVP38/TMEM64 family protein [Cyanobacteria bacterium P01_D01_bin.105]